MRARRDRVKRADERAPSGPGVWKRNAFLGHWPVHRLVVLAWMVVMTAGALVVEVRGEELPGHLRFEEVREDADFHVQGEYRNRDWGVQVMALGEGAFRAMVFAGGLPGDGWDGSEAVVLMGEREGARTRLVSESEEHVVEIGQEPWLWLEGDHLERVLLERVRRSSPTLGSRPPEGAVVLFDGRSVEAWEQGATMTADGLLHEGATSREHFADHRVHLEYLLAFMPEARDMARSNSGIYLQGRYEVQVVDSFGMPATARLNAGIYDVHAPRVPASYPPMQWQTLEIEFYAPRFDEAGKKVADARMSVWHNGVLVHEQMEVEGPTRAAPLLDEGEQGPVFLQPHGPLTALYRNVWVKELE